VLHEHALRTGARYGAELAKDLEELDEDILYDFWHRYVADWPDVIAGLPENPLGRLRLLLREVRRHPEAPLVPEPDRDSMQLELDFLRYATSELTRRKERQGVFGFDDLLARVAGALRGPGGESLAAGLRERFHAALVDEFQDTDPIQWEIVERVFVRGALPLFLIGDPKQAIYGFRGADVFTYLAAAEGARRSTMAVNWRSDPGLVGAVNRLFGSPDAFVFREIRPSAVVPRPKAANVFEAPTASGRASLELVLVEREDPTKPAGKPATIQHMPRVVAAEIALLLAGGATLEGRPVRAADIAVLTRDNNQCFLVQDALRARGVHSVVVSDKSVWTSEEALDLENVLRGVLDPAAGSARKCALATVILGKSGEWIDALARDPVLLEEWLERFMRWNRLWAERGFLRMFRELLREVSVPDRLLAQQGGERRLTNVLHLAELLERAAVERQLGPAALLDWLGEQQRDDSNRGEHTEIRLESDANAVKILTVHKSKGLEFSIVYCPFLWSGGLVANDKSRPQLFHDERRAFLDFDPDKERREPHIDIAKREGVAEELRVAYVALTRARHRCTVFWAAARYFGAAAFSFVVHPDPALLWKPKELKNTRLDTRSDEDLAAALAAFAEGSEGTIAFRRLPWRHDAPALPRVTSDPALLSAREVESKVVRFARTESFSGLTAGAHEAALEAARDGAEAPPDHDEQAMDAGGGETAGAPIVLSDFPRGSRAGNFFHEILEVIDFANVAPEDLLEVASEKFETFGFSKEFSGSDRDRLLAQAVHAVQDTLDTPLGEARLRLADVPSESRFSELEFRIPVAQRGAQREVTAQRLADVFRAHPSAEVPPSYAGKLERLRFERLHGFLKGYIDLVFFHEGLWYVVDYKTNHLGDFIGDYDGPRMQREMVASHYYLQYHLYTLAVDRFLRRVEPRYDYETSFGGVLYLFLKGLCPGHDTGVFFEKPPRARLQALSDLFDGVSA
jgi:exodeoxyribonuclease V beta subunit